MLILNSLMINAYWYICTYRRINYSYNNNNCNTAVAYLGDFGTDIVDFYRHLLLLFLRINNKCFPVNIDNYILFKLKKLI